jgi:2-hydroxy-3-oxopropionate reductase
MTAVVGFIGLGLMGKHMARNLLRAGYSLVVHNRSRDAVRDLASEGAAEAFSPREVAERASVIITMLPDSPDVQLVTGGDDGLFAGVSAGDIIIDCSTISPQVTAQLAEQAARQQVAWLDAPVSGGPAGAEAGALSIMVGGPATALAQVYPIFEVLGGVITHIGETPGSGQVAKACNQVACALTLQAVCEALLLAQAAGVDPGKVFQAIRGGAAGSWQMNTQAPKILDGDHAPGFKAWMHLKDLRIALDTAGAHHLPLPGTAQAVQLYQSVVKAGQGDQNISVLITALERLAGLTVQSNQPE